MNVHTESNCAQLHQRNLVKTCHCPEMDLETMPQKVTMSVLCSTGLQKRVLELPTLSSEVLRRGQRNTFDKNLDSEDVFSTLDRVILHNADCRHREDTCTGTFFCRSCYRGICTYPHIGRQR